VVLVVVVLATLHKALEVVQVQPTLAVVVAVRGMQALLEVLEVQE
jgi:hypothetical protein